jgi:hypothetical protein
MYRNSAVCISNSLVAGTKHMVESFLRNKINILLDSNNLHKQINESI